MQWMDLWIFFGSYIKRKSFWSNTFECNKDHDQKTTSLFACRQDTMYHSPRTTDTQWRHKSKKSEKSGRCGRQNMLRQYLKIWDWDLIFGCAVKAISSLGVRSPCHSPYVIKNRFLVFVLSQNYISGLLSTKTCE